MTRIAIVAARRTPQGRFLGALARRSSVDLAVAAGTRLIQDLPDPAIVERIDQTIIGNVLSAGSGMNVARQIAIRLNLPLASPAFSVNMMCASGMKAVMLACQAIRAGEAQLVLCGGTESMSQAPYLAPRVRSGLKLGDATLVDSVLHDGLIDAFDHQHMGVNADRLAAQFGISRQDQDDFAAESQRRCAAAVAAERFSAETAPLPELAYDEHPRPQTTAESLAKLAPAFGSQGTVTAGNASGLNDAAAMLLVCGAEFAERHGLKPLAFIDGQAECGCDPAQMGLGPVHATRKLLLSDRLKIEDFDAIEINEAFAAQALACIRSLSLADPAIVNPDGGAIALGHPIGASGARLIVHLAHRIDQGLSRHALATLCVGGGMGTAVRLTRPS